MAAPTFVTEVEGTAGWDSTTTPKTTPGITASPGDAVCLFSLTEGSGTLGTPTNTGTAQTWTQQKAFAGSGSAAAGKANGPTPGLSAALSANTISNTLTGGLRFNIAAYLFTGSGGIGASAINTPPTTAGTVSITTTQPNSAVVVMAVDFSAADGVGRTWATVNGTTPSAGNGFEKTYFRNSLFYTVYGAYYPDVGAAGAKTVGVTVGAGTPALTVIAVEILPGTAAASAAPQPIAKPGRTWLSRFHQRQMLPATPYVAALPPATDTATAGAFDWAGVAAASTAGVVAIATAGSLAWSGVRATSVSDVVTPTTVGSLAWSGVRASSAADVTTQAQVGSLALGGAAAQSANGITSPALAGSLAWSGISASSSAAVVSPALAGGLAWSGVAAQSTALGAGTTDTARAGSLAWSGIRANSAADVTGPSRVGSLAWSAVRATSAADVTNPAHTATLIWSGIRASSSSVIVQTDTARAGALSWGGTRAISAANVAAQARAGQLTWSGVAATSAGIGVNDGTPVQNPRLTLTPPTTRLTLHRAGELELTLHDLEDALHRAGDLTLTLPALRLELD